MESLLESQMESLLESQMESLLEFLSESLTEYLLELPLESPSEPLPPSGGRGGQKVKNGTWVTLYYQDMGYSWAPRLLSFRLRVDAGFSR